jgi:hypothetical protein
LYYLDWDCNGSTDWIARCSNTTWIVQ